MVHTRPLRVFGAGGVLLAVLSLSACALVGGGEASGASEGEALPMVDGAPDFQGPWAEDLRRDYLENDNQYWRAAIADGKISEAEFTESESRFGSCLKDAGITYEPLDLQTGGYGAQPPESMSPEELESHIEACDQTTGGVIIGGWYANMYRNPDGLDEGEEQVQCMIDQGLMEPGSKTEHIADWLGGEHSDSERKIARLCIHDPFKKLGMWPNEEK